MLAQSRLNPLNQNYLQKRERWKKDNKEPKGEEKTLLNIMLRAHLNRGVYSLVSRVHSLSAINEMIKAEVKY